jgi:hypothetical protein
LPEPVGALTTTEWPWLRASIASSWKGSRGKGKRAGRSITVAASPIVVEKGSTGGITEVLDEQ